ncbi:MAG TPA: hypothetical protein VGV89_04275 [Thermoplasmata archaeon]|nr:hypothetical protein [Thermoplasmata archaeon]
MGRAILLRRGGELRWVDASGTVGPSITLGRSAEESARVSSDPDAHLPRPVLERIRELRPPGPASAGEPWLRGALGDAAQVDPPTAEERRRGRLAVWGRAGRPDREFYLALARERIGRTLATPQETAIALAREEERLERVLGRESNASSQFLTPGKGPLEEYRRKWDPMQQTLSAHHRDLLALLESAARKAAPNLAGTVGARAAGRLLARAGSLGELARMSSSRLQLLGARRRPGPGRTPRFGVLFRAARMEEVPPARQGAYARSLAALASVAVRIDAAGGRDRSGELVARRDRRVNELRRRA